MEIGDNLRRRRERFSLTQEWVAEALDIPRELLSYWETGARTPNASHLRNLARIYRTTAAKLRDPNFDPAAVSPTDVLAAPEDLDDELGSTLDAWTISLDRWAEFLTVDLGRTLGGPDRPPSALAEPATVTDRRRASALADKAREHWDLGQLALPELYAFLDQQGIFVQRMPLGELGGAGGISGAFFNHGELGFCVVVNAQATPARQAFTLAHGIAHALYHHAEVGVLCRIMADDRVERFADAFGEQFLVPGKALRVCAHAVVHGAGRNQMLPMDALRLANLYRVSFPTIVMRLASERVIDDAKAAAWREIDGGALAERLGVVPPAFALSPGAAGPLKRYPTSVLATVAHAIEQKRATLERVADVLDVEPSVIEDHLLATPPEPVADEQKEHAEFAQLLAERTGSGS